MNHNELIWKRMDITRRRFQQRWTTFVRSVLMSQYKELAKSVTPDNANSAESLVRLMSDQPINMSLKRIYSDVGSYYAVDVIDQLKKSRVKSELEDRWRREFEAYIDTEAGAKITSITMETRRQAMKIIQGAVQQGLDDGLGADKLASLIRKRLVNDSITINQWRSLRIARTEVMSASSIGAYKGSGELGTASEKIWLATPSGDYRDSHLAANNQVRDREEPFDIGGLPMDHPHDPMAGPEEVINCRCAVAFKVKKI